MRSDLDHPPLDAYLTLKGWPEKGHGRKRALGQLLALGTGVVGEKGKTLFIQPLEQQYPTMRAPFGVHRGQSHGIGLDRWLLGFHRIAEPLMKQRERLERGLSLGQPVTGVVTSHIRQCLSHAPILPSISQFLA